MEHIQEKCVNVGREYLVQDFLPKNFEYKIKTCDVTEHSEQNIKFDIEMRVNVDSENGVKSFLGELNTSSGCTFRVEDKIKGRTHGHSTEDIESVVGMWLNILIVKLKICTKCQQMA